MSYSHGYCVALVTAGQCMRSFTWVKDERMDFIAMYRMGGEL